mgnify:CR=1 FL=1
MSIQAWDHFFKPEVRSHGRSFVSKGKVSLSRPSDTEIQTYVRASTSFKVTFKCDSIESKILTVDCTCPLSKKGQFCKHIWASLLTIDEKNSDFLLSKTELHKSSQVREDSQTSYKSKQDDYRKQQYQKQKQRLKEQKQSKKKITNSEEFPPAIETALKFFLDNGFALRESLTSEAVGLARKKLARVFHPDLGGSHSEILELNKFADVLTKFLKS